MTTTAPATPEADEKMREAARLAVQAGRVLAIREAPYLATPLLRMIVVETPDVPTAASDARWRFYYNPSFLAPLNPREAAAIWLHEVGHCLRGHCPRWVAIGEPNNRHMLWNVAGDAGINADVAEIVNDLPGDHVTFDGLREQGFDVERGQATEVIYRALLEKAESECPTHGQSGQGQPSSGQDDQSGEPGNSGDNSDNGSGEESGDNSGNQGSGPGQGNQSGDCTCGRGNTAADPGTGWDCGSAAGGDKRAWEKDKSEDGDGSLDEGAGDMVRQATATEIIKHARQNGRGSVPGGLLRMAEDILEPSTDWRTELRSTLSRQIAQHIGRKDYTFSRPSRRRIPGVVLPAMAAPPPPTVSVIVDTSGSMGDDDIAQALADIASLVKQSSRAARPVNVICCDAAAADSQAVRNISNLNLLGGGGTDMRVGIAQAAEARPKADVIITITDGMTPWPTTPPDANPTARYIAVITTDYDSGVPDWMTTILVNPRGSQQP